MLPFVLVVIDIAQKLLSLIDYYRFFYLSGAWYCDACCNFFCGRSNNCVQGCYNFVSG